MDLLLIRLMRAVALLPRQLLIYPHGYTDKDLRNHERTSSAAFMPVPTVI